MTTKAPTDGDGGVGKLVTRWEPTEIASRKYDSWDFLEGAPKSREEKAKWVFLERQFQKWNNATQVVSLIVTTRWSLIPSAWGEDLVLRIREPRKTCGSIPMGIPFSYHRWRLSRSKLTLWIEPGKLSVATTSLWAQSDTISIWDTANTVS